MFKLKTCTKCKESKSLDEFGKLLKSDDGHNYCCKACHRSYYTKKKIELPEGFKKCSSCEELKSNDSFSKSSKAKCGLKSSCKTCLSVKSKEYRENNQDVIKSYRENNKEYISIKSAEYYQNNKELVKNRVRLWGKNNPEKKKENHKRHRDKNKKKIQSRSNEWERNKRATDNEYRLTRNLRSLIGQSFSRILSGKLKRSRKSVDLLGCDFEFFFSYIEAKFKEGMTFENYGEWELDHVKPISSANNLIEVEQLNHYTNFQPLWKSENRAKSAKIESIQLKLI